ncbi:MAG: response regulator transcription factor [Deferribacterales bacterium]
MKQSEYLKNMTIMVAEDDDAVRESVVNAVGLFVENVIAVKDGRQALEMYENRKPDILLLDIEMPEYSGLQVAKKIREKDSSTPIFIVTSFQDINHIKEAIPLMLVEYIIKPLQFDQLRNALTKCVDYLDKHGQLLYSINNSLKYNKLSGELIYDDKPAEVLPKREKELLDMLINNKNRLLKKEFLEDTLFDIECSDSSLKNLVYRLKKRIQGDHIVNVKDMGYMFVPGKE